MGIFDYDCINHADGKILIVKTNEPTPQHVAAWYSTVLSIIKNWSESRPILLLYNLLCGPTIPSRRGCIMKLRTISISPPITVFVAIVTDQEYRRDFHLFANLTDSDTNYRLRLYTAYEEALRWLSSQL